MSTWVKKSYGSEVTSARNNTKLELATPRDFDWAQQQVTEHHYRHTPVIGLAHPVVYVIKIGTYYPIRAGCLIFGRPESTRCYDGNPAESSLEKGGLTYGSLDNIAAGKARYSYWELINLARVWIHKDFQDGGPYYIRNLATWAIGQALQQVVVDYLLQKPPCFLDQPWKLRICMSYCDTNTHAGTLYKAAGFTLVRTNDEGKQTWARKLRGLQGHERKQIERRSEQHPRSRAYRAARAAGVIEQASLNF